MKLETFKMKKKLNQIASGAAGAVLFLVGCVMAGIGLSVAVLLAMFALAAVGLAILASPFLALAQNAETEEAEEVAAS